MLKIDIVWRPGTLLLLVVAFLYIYLGGGLFSALIYLVIEVS